MILYKSGVPWTYYAGMNDTPRDGIMGAVFEASPHTIFSMLKAPWGELNTPIAIAGGSDATRRFGDGIFDLEDDFYNYQSVLAEWIGKKGTPQYIARVELPGMKKSNARKYIEIVEHTFPVYQRGIDGGFSYTPEGDKIPTGEYADGYKYRFFVRNGIDDFALGNGKAIDPSTLVGKLIDRDDDGNIINPSAPTFTDTAGIALPIADIQGKFMGALGDRILNHMWAPEDTDAVPGKTATIEKTGQMMYRFGHRLNAKNGGGNGPVYGVYGDEFIDFALKPGVLNESGTQIYMGDVYKSKFSLGQQTYTGGNIHAPTDIHLYDKNIKMILDMFLKAETAAKAVDVNYPCWIKDDEAYSINLLEPNDHYGVPYHALGMVEITDQPIDGYHSPYEDSLFSLAGGNDGDLSDSAYNVAVKNYCDNVKSMFEIWDMMQYQIGWTYDLGYEVDTKKSLYSLMHHNQSLIVVASTEEDTVDDKNTDDTISTAIALDSAYGLYPESTIYKTAPTRGVIVPYSIDLKLHKWKDKLPLTFSLAKKLNDYIGFATKIWKPANDPMLERNKGIDEILRNFVSLDLPQRTNFWNTQLVIVETIQHEVRGFTGLQTINDNDSSVLNNLLVVAAVGCAVRAGYEAGVVFRGQTAPPSTMAKRHEDRILAETAGIDKTKAKVDVVSHQTSDDYNAGYAITDTITVSGYQAITAVTLELNTQYATEE